MTRSPHGSVGTALLLGLAHALVDASCAFVLFRDLSREGIPPPAVFAWILTYDIVAFATQPAVGLLADRLRADGKLSRCGVALVVFALAVGPVSPRSAAALAALGNALFHVGAGAHLLATTGQRAREIGLFVGPGAVGLACGIVLGRTALPIRGVLLLLGLAAWFASRAIQRDPRPPLAAPGDERPTAGLAHIALLLLLLTVVLRSLVGDTVVAAWRPRSTAIVLALAAAACAGKMLGGLIADRIGWLTTAGGALLLASPLLAGGPSEPVLACAGLLLLQTTMPLTLKAVHHAMPGRPGLAFGLPAAALLLGALPGLLGAWPLSGASLQSTGAALSAIAVVSGLALLARSGIALGPANDPILSGRRRA